MKILSTQIMKQQLMRIKSYTRYISFGNISIIAGFLLIIAGLFIISQQVGGLFRHNPVLATTTETFLSNSEPAREIPRTEGKPVRIEVPSVGINLPIIDGFYNSKNASWTLSLDKAQFGTMTSPANNQSGNTFIYAHNRRGVFMTLPNVKEGDIAIVTTDNNKVFSYRFRTAVTTKPEDTSLLVYNGAPILSLQTCTGLWYQNRTLFMFDFESVKG